MREHGPLAMTRANQTEAAWGKGGGIAPALSTVSVSLEFRLDIDIGLGSALTSQSHCLGAIFAQLSSASAAGPENF